MNLAPRNDSKRFGSADSAIASTEVMHTKGGIEAQKYLKMKSGVPMSVRTSGLVMIKTGGNSQIAKEILHPGSYNYEKGANNNTAANLRVKQQYTDSTQGGGGGGGGGGVNIMQMNERPVLPKKTQMQNAYGECRQELANMRRQKQASSGRRASGGGGVGGGVPLREMGMGEISFNQVSERSKGNRKGKVGGDGIGGGWK